MGQTLDKPIDAKYVESGEGNDLKYGLSCMHGWRLDMEDAHSAIPYLPDNFGSCSYYAVFDGHAGFNTSTVCSKELHKTILKNLVDVDITLENFDDATSELIIKIIKDSFVEFDENLKSSDAYKSMQESCGTTAICAFISPYHVIFCNCGDSRGFLARDGSVFFQTKDHKPSDPYEKARIEASGGSVVMERVNGNLAVSRALGDFSFKDKVDLDPRKQAVSPEPTVTIIKREKDDFLVLACDGIWDVMDCESVRYFIECRMKVKSNLQDITNELVDMCLMKDSRDNMSVIIVSMDNTPKLCHTEIEQESILDSQIHEFISDFINTNKNITLLNALEFISTKELHPCLASRLGVYTKTRLVEFFLDDFLPKRSKERDYSSGNFLSNFPVALQAIQNIVRTDRFGDNETGHHDDSSSSETCDDQEDYRKRNP